MLVSFTAMSCPLPPSGTWLSLRAAENHVLKQLVTIPSSIHDGSSISAGWLPQPASPFPPLSSSRRSCRTARYEFDLEPLFLKVPRLQSATNSSRSLGLYWSYCRRRDIAPCTLISQSRWLCGSCNCISVMADEITEGYQAQPSRHRHPRHLWIGDWMRGFYHLSRYHSV